MILIGRDLSPFVRRTAIVFETLNLSYERKKLASLDPAEYLEIRKITPLGRVPALILADGEILIDSQAIIDFALEIGDTDHALLPADGAARRAVLRSSAFAVGTMEKGVASSYERKRRPAEKIYQPWLDHIHDQVTEGLKMLETLTGENQAEKDERPTLADINAVVAYDFIKMIQPELADQAAPTALPTLSRRLNKVPAFKDTQWIPASA